MSSLFKRGRNAVRVLVSGILLGACTGVPDGVSVVRDFDLESYLGTWYEIARLDHRFERGLSRVTATYSRRDDGGVQVVNRGFDSKNSEWNEAGGKAYFVADPSLGKLKVSFFGPFYGAYNVIELGDDYEYSMVVGPNTSYLWILSRSPTLDPDILNRLVSKASSLGFATDELIYVEHEKD